MDPIVRITHCLSGEESVSARATMSRYLVFSFRVKEIKLLKAMPEFYLFPEKSKEGDYLLGA